MTKTTAKLYTFMKYRKASIIQMMVIGMTVSSLWSCQRHDARMVDGTEMTHLNKTADKEGLLQYNPSTSSSSVGSNVRIQMNEEANQLNAVSLIDRIEEIERECVMMQQVGLIISDIHPCDEMKQRANTIIKWVATGAGVTAIILGGIWYYMDPGASTTCIEQFKGTQQAYNNQYEQASITQRNLLKNAIDANIKQIAKQCVNTMGNCWKDCRTYSKNLFECQQGSNTNWWENPSLYGSGAALTGVASYCGFVYNAFQGKSIVANQLNSELQTLKKGLLPTILSVYDDTIKKIRKGQPLTEVSTRRFTNMRADSEKLLDKSLEVLRKYTGHEISNALVTPLENSCDAALNSQISQGHEDFVILCQSYMKDLRSAMLLDNS